MNLILLNEFKTEFRLLIKIVSQI